MQAVSCAKVHDSWMWDTVVVIGITCVCVRVCVQFQKLKTNKISTCRYSACGIKWL